MTTAGELCTREVTVMDLDEPLMAAAELMRNQHVGTVVVVQQRDGVRVPVGIVTDRDIVVGVLATTPEKAALLTMADVLATPLVTARASDDVLDVVRRMRAHGVRRMPVVNAQGTLEGILTLDDVVDLLSELARELSAIIKVEQDNERRTRTPPRPGAGASGASRELS
ncbi:MAG: CBS domain-containing protein [Myxococcota bacterium]